MKTALLSLFVFFISLSCFSQSLEGEWNGLYTINGNYTRNTTGNQIRLKFVLNKDSSYTVYSNSDDLDFNFVYLVSYKRISGDSIILEEQRIIEPANQKADNLQKMYLKIQPKKKTLSLTGVWVSRTYLNHQGEIYLDKKITK